MIKYKLVCKNCDNLFDSWFSTSKEYEKLRKLHYINCIYCDSKSVEKTLMSPNILSSSKDIIKINRDKKFFETKNKMKEYQNFIKNNFKYVGENFSYEARSIHYNKKNFKGIYGKASDEEIKELKEEGIELLSIPWVEEKNN